MTTIHKIKSLLILTLLVFLISSCVSDEWNNHYDSPDQNVTSSTLTTSIKSNPQLSTFASMLEICGYDTILNSPQSYTVWAPDNAALENVLINPLDTVGVGNFVRNHIARFNYPASGFNQLLNKRVLMLSSKIINYSKTADSISFGDHKLVGKSILTSNGTLHTLNGYVPYKPNIWEYLSLDERLSSIWSYWQPLGGTPYGQINNEDSTYTAILPSNDAWDLAYASTKEYFKCLPNSGIDSSELKQRRLTNNAIVSDLIYSHTVNDFTAPDSLISTNWNTISNVSDLFKDAEHIVASNGDIYLTDSIQTNPKETWNKPILIEAEYSEYGRSSLNASINPLNGSNSSFPISNSYYVEVYPLTTTNISQVAVTFPIPNTLSTKYNIYCRFIPASIKETKPADQLPCLASFYLDYVNANGIVINSQQLVTNVETSGTEVRTVLVKDFTFPFCNIYNGNTSDITVKLKVANAAKTNQTTKYTRTMRIDCIILVPVN